MWSKDNSSVLKLSFVLFCQNTGIPQGRVPHSPVTVCGSGGRGVFAGRVCVGSAQE